MRIEVKGRNTPVTDELREHVVKRFRKIARQVSELAVLEIELTRGAQPAPIPEPWVAEATLYLKGVHAARPGGLAATSTTRST